MGGVYHITMLVSGEQEDAIRLLFRDKNWPCWIKVLSNELLANLIQGGFPDVFPEIENHKSTDTCSSEIIALDDAGNDTSSSQGLSRAGSLKNEADHQKLNTPEYKPSFTNDDNDFGDNDDGGDDNDRLDSPSLNISENITSSVIDIDEDTMDYDISQDKWKENLTEIKVENVPDVLSHSNNENEGVGKVAKSESNSEGKFDCTICGMHLATRSTLKKHFNRRHKGKWLDFECKDCPAKFKTKEELWDHRRIAQHKPDKIIIASNKDKKLHTPEELLDLGHVQCDICLNYYPNRKSLRRHTHKVHKGVLTWTCGVCGDVFSSREAYWKHMRDTNHKTSISMLESYMCDSCGKIINKYDSFKEHKATCITDGRTAEELKTVPCDSCGLMFKSLSQMRSHKRGVHQVNPSTCEICGAVRKNRRALSAHKLRHDPNNRRFACDECGKSFFNRHLLGQHIRTHSKEKPFKCPMCNYRCAIKQNIHKHAQKVHKTQATALSPFGELNPSVHVEMDMPIDSIL